MATRTRLTRQQPSSNGSVTFNGGWHPLALTFAPHPEEEIELIAESIAKIGLRDPLVHDPQGLGLDGRGRLSACKLAGEEPRWVVFDGNPVDYIIGVNVGRRKLGTAEQVMGKAIELKADGKRRDGRWNYGAARFPGSGKSKDWNNRMQEAGVILDWGGEVGQKVLTGDELAAQVLLGAVAFDAAYKLASSTKRKTETLEKLDPDLAAKVISGSLTVEEALKRVEINQRIAELRKRYPDLADKVENGDLAISDAEELANDSDERLEAWVTDIVRGIQVFREMAGDPVPDEIKQALGEDEDDLKALTAILRVLKGLR